MQKQKSQYLNHSTFHHNIDFRLYLNHCHPVIQYGSKLSKKLEIVFLPWPESYRSLRTWFSFLISFSWEFLFHAESSCKIVCTSKNLILRFCVDGLGWAQYAVLTLSEGFVLRLRYNCAHSALYHSVQRSFCMGDLGCQGGWPTATL